MSLIGAGNMGEAMLKGWLGSGTLKPEDVVVRDRVPARGELLSGRYGVSLAEDNAGAAGESKIVVLAVKPQDSGEVLDEISGVDLEGKVILSIVAGLSLGSLRAGVGGEPSLVRVMPNMAASAGAAVSAYTVDPGSRGLDREQVLRLLEAIGEIVEVEEEWMDLVTALSGSGPAYFFLLVEALEMAGVDGGLPRDTARMLARETLWGAARVLKESGREAGDLRESVSSPGGTTVAALGKLEDAGFVEAVGDAVCAARSRAGELTR
ncbi:MAG: pyrroline-5-carboxylate reductase [Actinobacteria bacterium]|nr:pyrroline-5-carboxylate reductase [Actinomycetota bacterium]